MSGNEADPIQVVYINVDDLIPYINNSRTHSEAQVAQIAASIQEFGWTNPILIDGDKGIVAGHGRFLAARKLGREKAPCIELSHLSPAQKRAYVIADNKLALNAGWDAELLKNELLSLNEESFDLSLTGFDTLEISTLLDAPDFLPASEEEQGRLDEKKKVKCPNCEHEFEPKD